MPRKYDFSDQSEHSEDDDLFKTIRNPTLGPGELEMEDLIGPNGLHLFDGYHFQFALVPPAGTNPYDNAFVDPIYDWLSNNAVGGWRWEETESNHGHSVTTQVYIADAETVERFQAEWGGLFRFKEKDEDDNRRLSAREREAEEKNELPPYFGVNRLATMLTAFYPYTATYLDRLSDRNGFDAAMVSAIKKADEIYQKYSYDPERAYASARNEDGTLDEGLIPYIHAFASWLRKNASIEVARAVADMEFCEPEFGVILQEAGVRRLDHSTGITP